MPRSSAVRSKNTAARLPAAGDILLIVEVSDTTYAKDRGRKYRRYAAHQLPIYWIVDLNRRRVEVFRSPAGKSYGTVDVYQEGDLVPVVLDGQHLGSVAVADILTLIAPEYRASISTHSRKRNGRESIMRTAKLRG